MAMAEVCSSTRRPGTTKGFAAVAHVRKGEDKWCAVEKNGGEAVYGLFDGHGGSSLASEVARMLPGMIMRGERSVDGLVEAFYQADSEVGAKFATEGSTATIASVNRGPRGASVWLAWVGDSRSISVDVLAKALVWQSSVHHVTNKHELDRVRLQWKLRELAESETGTAYEQLVDRVVLDHQVSSSRTSKKSSDEDTDTSSYGNLPSSGSEDALRDLLTRAKTYEDRLAACDAAHDMGGVVRSQSFVGRRYNFHGTPCGPVVLQSTWRPPDPDSPLVRGASTCVTRALGDWDSSRTLLPHPEVARHDLALADAPVWRRYVIASDGLWDVVSPKKAAKLVAAELEPSDAANALLNTARRIYMKKLDKTKASGTDPFKDDTTILVFDVKLGVSVAVVKSVLPTLPSFPSFGLRSNGSEPKRAAYFHSRSTGHALAEELGEEKDRDPKPHKTPKARRSSLAAFLRSNPSSSATRSASS